MTQETRWYSFAVAPHEPELIEYLDAQKAIARGNLSKIIRDALKAQMSQHPPKWFEEWLKMTPVVQQQVEEEVEKMDLDGLFEP